MTPLEALVALGLLWLAASALASQAPGPASAPAAPGARSISAAPSPDFGRGTASSAAPDPIATVTAPDPYVAPYVAPPEPAKPQSASWGEPPGTSYRGRYLGGWGELWTKRYPHPIVPMTQLPGGSFGGNGETYSGPTTIPMPTLDEWAAFLARASSAGAPAI